MWRGKTGERIKENGDGRSDRDKESSHGRDVMKDG